MESHLPGGPGLCRRHSMGTACKRGTAFRIRAGRLAAQLSQRLTRIPPIEEGESSVELSGHLSKILGRF